MWVGDTGPVSAVPMDLGVDLSMWEQNPAEGMQCDQLARGCPVTMEAKYWFNSLE